MSAALFARFNSGSFLVKAPQNTPTIEQPLSKREVERNLRDVAGGETHYQETSLPGHVAQCGFRVRDHPPGS